MPKKCPHSWQPLVSPTTDNGRLYALLRKLHPYETCELCGRLSYLGLRRRVLVSNEWTEVSVRNSAAACK